MIARPLASSDAAGRSSASPGKWPVTSSSRLATPSPSLSSPATAATRAGMPDGLPAFLSSARTALSRLPKALCGRSSDSSAPGSGSTWQRPAVVELPRQARAQVVGQRLLVRRPRLGRQGRQGQPGRRDRHDPQPAPSISHGSARGSNPVERRASHPASRSSTGRVDRKFNISLARNRCPTARIGAMAGPDRTDRGTRCPGSPFAVACPLPAVGVGYGVPGRDGAPGWRATPGGRFPRESRARCPDRDDGRVRPGRRPISPPGARAGGTTWWRR